MRDRGGRGGERGERDRGERDRGAGGAGPRTHHWARERRQLRRLTPHVGRRRAPQRPQAFAPAGGPGPLGAVAGGRGALGGGRRRGGGGLRGVAGGPHRRARPLRECAGGGGGGGPDRVGVGGRGGGRWRDWGWGGPAPPPAPPSVARGARGRGGVGGGRGGGRWEQCRGARVSLRWFPGDVSPDAGAKNLLPEGLRSLPPAICSGYDEPACPVGR